MTQERAKGSSRWGGAWEILLLGAIVALGLWFRWLYARDVSFFVDEYLTARAAQKILEEGLPLLPSGNFYSHGLLLSYVEAAIVGLGAAKSCSCACQCFFSARLPSCSPGGLDGRHFHLPQA